MITRDLCRLMQGRIAVTLTKEGEGEEEEEEVVVVDLEASAFHKLHV